MMIVGLRRECGHSMALLGESCRVLLHCLAAPSWSDAADSSLPSKAAEAAQCGGWLSRVYQEVFPGSGLFYYVQ